MRATKTFFRPFLLSKRKGPKKAAQNNASARPVSRLEIIQKECPALGGTNVNAFCLFLRPEPFTPDAGPPFWAACPQEGLAGMGKLRTAGFSEYESFRLYDTAQVSLAHRPLGEDLREGGIVSIYLS